LTLKVSYPGHLAIQQRVLPVYRVPFFDLLAHSCARGLSLIAGSPRQQEGIATGVLHCADHFAVHNTHILSGPLYFCYQKGLITLLADLDPDALIVEANPRYLATPAAVRWMHARGKKVIGWGLGAPPLSGAFKGLGQMRRRNFFRNFDALVSYSQRGAEEYEALGISREKIFIAPNAVSSSASALGGKRSASRAQMNILFVGRLQERKRVDFLLRACAEMSEPKPRLVIVGDGPERQNLERLGKQVYPGVEFTGAKHGEELKSFYREADLFVLPGTGGLAVQEAMANGLPVLVAKGDGTQDDLVRGGNGWQIKPEDYGALLSTLKEALADRRRLQKMGRESRRIVSQEINLEKMVEAFVTALNSLQG
jgi:glycosyltransferase involved in cell wall biosynthesis